jgi:hypothetical protein
MHVNIFEYIMHIFAIAVGRGRDTRSDLSMSIKWDPI